MKALETGDSINIKRILPAKKVKSNNTVYLHVLAMTFL